MGARKEVPINTLRKLILLAAFSAYASCGVAYAFSQNSIVIAVVSTALLVLFVQKLIAKLREAEAADALSASVNHKVN